MSNLMKLFSKVLDIFAGGRTGEVISSNR